MLSVARVAITAACLLPLCSCDIISAELAHYVRIEPETYDTVLAHAIRFTPDRDGILVQFPEVQLENEVLLVDHPDPPHVGVAIGWESGIMVLTEIWFGHVPDASELDRAERFQFHVYGALRSRMPTLPPAAQLRRWYWDWSEGDRPSAPFDPATAK